MSRLLKIRPVYTDRIPKDLDEGVFYISRKFSTAAHACLCGCGTKIVTPLKPGRWELSEKDGRVSLSPSVGNWSAECQSHYVIDGNCVKWSVGFSPAQIAANRAGDRQASSSAHAERRARERSLWGRLVTAYKAIVAFFGRR